MSSFYRLSRKWKHDDHLREFEAKEDSENIRERSHWREQFSLQKFERISDHCESNTRAFKWTKHLYWAVIRRTSRKLDHRSENIQECIENRFVAEVFEHQVRHLIRREELESLQNYHFHIRDWTILEKSTTTNESRVEQTSCRDVLRHFSEDLRHFSADLRHFSECTDDDFEMSREKLRASRTIRE